MRQKHKLLVLVIFVLAMLNVPYACAKKIDIIADADAFVMDSEPTNNYGNSEHLYVSGIGYIGEAYIHFSFTNIPEDWITAEINIQIFSGPTSPFNVMIYNITEEWDEYTLNWNNKPSHGEIIANLLINDISDDIVVDISNYIMGDGIDICLKTLQSINLYLYSREGLYPPKVIVDIGIINGYSIIFIIFSSIGLIFVLYRRKTLHLRKA